MVATPGEIDALPDIVAAAVTNPKNALYSGISAIEATLKKTAPLPSHEPRYARLLLV